MFCTSIRRRPAFASVVTKLTAPPLSLRESQLGTHDLEVKHGSTVDQKSGNTLSSRQLRVLLLSPADVQDGKLESTVERVQHFAALTGGQDLIIVFLLNAPPATSFVPARTTLASDKTYTSIDGVYAYSKLQSETVNRSSIPHVPIMPLHSVDGLPRLVKKHIDTLTRSKPPQKLSIKPLDILQLCTANPPMPQQTAFILSDLFPNLKELAIASLTSNSAPTSSSPSVTARGHSSQLTTTSDLDPYANTQYSDPSATNKLKRLRDLVGEPEYHGIIDFWKEEWTID